MANRGGLPAPDRGLLLTHFLTVRDVARSTRVGQATGMLEGIFADPSPSDDV